MRIRNMLLALLACTALTAVAADAAQAAEHWNINGSELTGSETVSVEGGPWSLVGETLGVKVELTAEHVACGSTCTISGEGASAGTLKYTGVTVMKPAGCTAHSPGEAAGNVKTNALKDKVIMDPSNVEGPVFDKFTPNSGSVFVEVDFAGTECVLAGDELPVEGSAGGESPNETGVEKVEQSLTFGSTQQTTSGTALTLGGGSVVLSGTATNKLSGTNVGKGFAAQTAKVQWNPATLYGEGAIVEHKGKCYRAKVQNRNSEPPNINWEPVPITDCE